jgi:CBS domain-containing protein
MLLRVSRERQAGGLCPDWVVLGHREECLAMADGQIFTSRLRGRPLLDSKGMTIGRIRDVVLFPSAGNEPPRALGLVVTLQRRRIFVNLGQITEISIDGAHLPGGAVELERFNRRTGEMMASELYGQHTGDGTIVDVAISPSDGNRAGWEVSALAISHGLSLLPGGRQIVPWDQYPKLFQADPLTEQLAGLRDLRPADLANAVEGLPPSRRDQIAAALNDEELADLLEEMPEQDQVRLLTSLGPDRGADVVEEMQPDDAADLLAEMPTEQRERLLTAMESIQADDLRRLLRYDATTAGGLMTSQPVIVAPDTPVAEMLARIMDRDVPTTAAAQVYVCEPPLITPTGRYLGSVGFQRLLRRPPAMLAAECVDQNSVFVRPDLPERELAARLAAYNLVSVAVCDETGRLVGAVTVDDVLDHMLPADWRKTGG